MNAAQKNISAYLASHFYLRLGTVTVSCTPQVHTVGYLSEDCTVYFLTDKKSRKAGNISREPRVAYAVDENYEDLMAIRGVQMEGRASLVTLKTETMRLRDLIARKFAGMEKIPANPDLVIFKIEPTIGYFLDNTVAFGHRDKVEF